MLTVACILTKMCIILTKMCIALPCYHLSLSVGYVPGLKSGLQGVTCRLYLSPCCHAGQHSWSVGQLADGAVGQQRLGDC